MQIRENTLKVADVSRVIPPVPNRPAKPYLVARPSAAKETLCLLPQEGEDAKLTGMTRSLNRRLLGLNIGGTLAQKAVEASS